MDPRDDYGLTTNVCVGTETIRLPACQSQMAIVCCLTTGHRFSNGSD